MYRFIPYLIFFVVFLTACASSGNTRLKEMEQTDVLARIKEGETTKAQVEAMLGPANSASYTDSLKEVWSYYHSKSTPHGTNFIPYVSLFSSGQDVRTKELIIIFDADGVVLKRSLRENTVVQKQGILGKM